MGQHVGISSQRDAETDKSLDFPIAQSVSNTRTSPIWIGLTRAVLDVDRSQCPQDRAARTWRRSGFSRASRADELRVTGVDAGDLQWTRVCEFQETHFVTDELDDQPARSRGPATAALTVSIDRSARESAVARSAHHVDASTRASATASCRPQSKIALPSIGTRMRACMRDSLRMAKVQCRPECAARACARSRRQTRDRLIVRIVFKSS